MYNIILNMNNVSVPSFAASIPAKHSIRQLAPSGE